MRRVVVAGRNGALQNKQLPLEQIEVAATDIAERHPLLVDDINANPRGEAGLTTRIGIDVIDEQWMALGDISGSHLDLLERQLLILQRAIAPSDDDTPQGFLPF